MNCILQIGVILLFSFLGEVCAQIFPFNMPASIYGMVLIFLALRFNIIKKEQIESVGNELVKLLPMLFIVPVISILDYWKLISKSLIAIFIIVFISTIVTFGVSGIVTQYLITRKGKNNADISN